MMGGMKIPAPLVTDRYLIPGEVAAMFSVDPRTVTRWREKGRLDSVRMFLTPGGAWRYNEADLLALRGSAGAGG
jgi:predicted site-specific integrase-resolvase